MASVLTVSINSNLSEYPTEKRYDKNIIISELKKKLELITGANHLTMKIHLQLDDKQSVELSNDSETLGHYVDQLDCKDVILKLIVNDDQNSNILSGDTPKYTIPEEKYQSRSDTARNFIKQVREKQSSGTPDTTIDNK